MGDLRVRGVVAAAWVAAAIALVLLPGAAAAKRAPKTGAPSSATSTAAAPPATILPGNTGASPFSPGVPQNAAPVTTATPPVVAGNSGSNSSAGGGLSGTDALIIGVGALIVLAGIAFFIWRDARRRAPVTAGAGARGEVAGVPGSKRKPKRKLSAAERRRRKRGRAR